MNVRRLDHVQLAMPSGGEDKARAFYGGVLGIPEKPKPAHLVKRGGVWFQSGALKVHLGVEADFRPTQKAHPAFEVEDLEKLLAACREHGYRVVEDEPLEGRERAYVYDPFGNRIELLQSQDSESA